MTAVSQPTLKELGKVTGGQAVGQVSIDDPERSWNPLVVPRELYQREQWNWQSQQPVSLTVEVNGKRDLMKYAAVMQFVPKLGFVARLGQPGAAAKFQNLHLIDVKRRGGTDIHVSLGDLAWAQARTLETSPASTGPGRPVTAPYSAAASPSIGPEASEAGVSVAEACTLAGRAAEGGGASGASSEGTTTQVLGPATAAAAATAAEGDVPGTSSENRSHGDACSDHDATGTSPVQQQSGPEGLVQALEKALGSASCDGAAGGKSAAAGADAEAVPLSVPSFRCGYTFCPCHFEAADLAEAAAVDQGALDSAASSFGPMPLGRRLSGSNLLAAPPTGPPVRLASLPPGAPVSADAAAAPGGPSTGHISRERLRNILIPALQRSGPGPAAQPSPSGAAPTSVLHSTSSAPAALAAALGSQATDPAGHSHGGPLLQLIGCQLVLPAELAAKRMNDKHVLVQYEIDGEFEDCKMQYRLIRSDDGQTLSLQGVSRPLRGLLLTGLSETEEGDLFMRAVTPSPEVLAAAAAATVPAAPAPGLPSAAQAATAAAAKGDGMPPAAVGRTSSSRQRRPSLKARERAEDRPSDPAAAGAPPRTGSLGNAVPGLPPLYPVPVPGAGAPLLAMPPPLPPATQQKRRGRPPRPQAPGPPPSLAPVSLTPPLPLSAHGRVQYGGLVQPAGAGSADGADTMQEDSQDGASSPGRYGSCAGPKRPRSDDAAEGPVAIRAGAVSLTGSGKQAGLVVAVDAVEALDDRTKGQQSKASPAASRRRRSSVAAPPPPGASPAPAAAQAPAPPKQRRASSSTAAGAAAGAGPAAALPQMLATPPFAASAAGAPQVASSGAASPATAALTCPGMDGANDKASRKRPSADATAAEPYSGIPPVDPPAAAKRMRAAAERKQASRGSVPPTLEEGSDAALGLRLSGVVSEQRMLEDDAEKGEAQAPGPSPQGSEAEQPAGGTAGARPAARPRRSQAQVRQSLADASTSSSDSETKGEEGDGLEDGESRPPGAPSSATVGAARGPEARGKRAAAARGADLAAGAGEAGAQSGRAKPKARRGNNGSKNKPVRHPSKITNVVRNAGAILLMVGRSPLMYEKQLRTTFGNNPDTSKALRLLEEQGRVVRGGLGYRMHPYHYTLTPAGIEEYERLLRDKGPSHAFALSMGVSLPEDGADGQAPQSAAAASAAPAATAGVPVPMIPAVPAVQRDPGAERVPVVLPSHGATAAAAALEAAGGSPLVAGSPAITALDRAARAVAAGAGSGPSPGGLELRTGAGAAAASLPGALAGATAAGGTGALPSPGLPSPRAQDLLSSGGYSGGGSGSGGAAAISNGQEAVRQQTHHQQHHRHQQSQSQGQAAVPPYGGVEIKPEVADMAACGTTGAVTGPVFDPHSRPQHPLNSPVEEEVRSRSTVLSSEARAGSIGSGQQLAAAAAQPQPRARTLADPPLHGTPALAARAALQHPPVSPPGSQDPAGAPDASGGAHGRSAHAGSPGIGARPATSSTASQQQSYQPQTLGAAEAGFQSSLIQGLAEPPTMPGTQTASAAGTLAVTASAAPLPPTAVVLPAFAGAAGTSPVCPGGPVAGPGPAMPQAAPGQVVYASCPPMAYPIAYPPMAYPQHSPQQHHHALGVKADAEGVNPQGVMPYGHPYAAMYGYVPTPFGYMPYPMYNAYASAPAGPGGPPGALVPVPIMSAAPGMHPHAFPHAMAHATVPRQSVAAPAAPSSGPLVALPSGASAAPSVSPVASPTALCQPAHGQASAAPSGGAAAAAPPAAVCMAGLPHGAARVREPSVHGSGALAAPQAQQHLGLALPLTATQEESEGCPPQPMILLPQPAPAFPLLPRPETQQLPPQQQQQPQQQQFNLTELPQGASHFRYVVEMPCSNFRAEVPGLDGRLYCSPGFTAAMQAAAAADLLIFKLRPGEQLNLGISAQEEATLAGLTVEGVQAMLWSMSGQS